jgi:hypothetical protein
LSMQQPGQLMHQEPQASPAVSEQAKKLVDRAVQRQPLAQHGGASGSEAELGGLLVPGQMAAGGQGAGPAGLVIPSAADLQMALERSTTIEQLADFDRMMAVLEEASARFGFLIEEAIRIASFQLSGKRRLGHALLQSSIHGGDRSRSHTANLLGSGTQAAIDKDRRRRYKALARIPEDVFTGYLRAKSEKKEIPKEAGALRWVSAAATARRSPRPRSRRVESATPLPANLVAECVRILGNVDVLVGKVKCPASVQVDGLKDLVKKARGRVLVVDATSPEEAVRCLARLVRAGRIEEALVVLPRDIDHAWLAAMSEDPWSCCIPRDAASPIVGHIGGRTRGFALVFSQCGVVLDVESSLAIRADEAS